MNKKHYISGGEKYGNYTILFEAEQSNKRRMVYCKCLCGKEKFVRLIHLTSGAIKSCGCKTLETREKMSISHIGRIAWNKGTRGICKAWNKGIKCPQISEAKKGKIFTEQHKANISKACKGRISPMKGKRLSLKHRQKIGNRYYPRQQEHFNWKGGETKRDYGGLFTEKLKRKIRYRDNNICQICEQLVNKNDIHHIDYNKKNNKENNLICLCHSCHSKTNFNRIKWRLYFLKKDIDAGLAKTVLHFN